MDGLIPYFTAKELDSELAGSYNHKLTFFTVYYLSYYIKSPKFYPKANIWEDYN